MLGLVAFGSWARDEQVASPFDYLKRSAVRLRALEILYEGESRADVVRESQEVVELALNGLLRAYGVEPPRVHDVSALLLEERERLPTGLHAQLPRLAEISRDLRRDRELAFYGAEDLTPGTFYSRADADRARHAAAETVAAVEKYVTPARSSRA